MDNLQGIYVYLKDTSPDLKIYIKYGSAYKVYQTSRCINPQGRFPAVKNNSQWCLVIPGRYVDTLLECWTHQNLWQSWFGLYFGVRRNLFYRPLVFWNFFYFFIFFFLFPFFILPQLFQGAVECCGFLYIFTQIRSYSANLFIFGFWCIFNL